MRNSLLLITLGTVLFLSTSTPLQAQAPPDATTPDPTNQPVAFGVLASPVVFERKSGPFVGFVAQIKEVFGIDLNQRADIPGQMLRVRVPSMKLKVERLWDVLSLYNQINSNYPEIGRWVWHFPGNDWKLEPSAIYLVPPKQTDLEDALSVRAFTLRDIPGPEQNQLFELINMEGDRLKLETERGIKASLLGGDVHFHKETGICVATGGKTYVEMVGSLIDAFREGRHTGSAPRPYSTKPQDAK